MTIDEYGPLGSILTTFDDFGCPKIHLKKGKTLLDKIGHPGVNGTFFFWYGPLKLKWVIFAEGHLWAANFYSNRFFTYFYT